MGNIEHSQHTSIYTPASFVCGGYTVFTLSVCAFMPPSMRPSETFFSFLYLEKSLLEFHQIFHQIYKTNTLNKKVWAMGQFY